MTQHEWLAKHFQELVEKYGGYYLALANNKVVGVAYRAKEALEKGKQKINEKEIALFKVPRKEELTCILK